MSIIKKELEAFARELYDIAPHKGISRTWTGKNGKQYELCIANREVYMFDTWAKERQSVPLSHASHSVMLKLLPGIRKEIDVLKAQMENFYKIECSDEVNQMLSSAIINGDKINTDLQDIFIEAIDKRAEKLTALLGELPIPNEFVRFSIDKTFKKEGSANNRVEIEISSQWCDGKVLNNVTLEKKGANSRSALENTLLIHLYWPDITAFYAKVFYNLGMVRKRMLADMAANPPTPVVIDPDDEFKDEATGDDLLATDLVDDMPEWAKIGNLAYRIERNHENSELINKMYRDWIPAALSNGEITYGRNTNDLFEIALVDQRRALYDDKIVEIMQSMPDCYVTVAVMCPSNNKREFTANKDRVDIAAGHYLSGYNQHNAALDALLKFLRLMKGEAI